MKTPTFTIKKNGDEIPILPCTEDDVKKMSKKTKDVKEDADITEEDLKNAEALVDEELLKSLNDPKNRQKIILALAKAKAKARKDSQNSFQTSAKDVLFIIMYFILYTFVFFTLVWGCMNIINYVWGKCNVKQVKYYTVRAPNVRAFPPKAAEVADGYLREHAAVISEEKMKGFYLATALMAKLENAGVMTTSFPENEPVGIEAFDDDSEDEPNYSPNPRSREDVMKDQAKVDDEEEYDDDYERDVEGDYYDEEIDVFGQNLGSDLRTTSTTIKTPVQ